MVYYDKELVTKIKQQSIENDSKRTEMAEKVNTLLTSNSFFPEPAKDTNYVVNALNGIFLSSEIDWENIKKLLGPKGKNYAITFDEMSPKLEEKIKLKQKVFPIKKITKDFSISDEYALLCVVEISFETRLVTKTEAINHLYTVKEKAHETEEWLKPLTNWLNDQKVNTFYFVVDFEIVCSFDVEKYLKLKNDSMPKPKVSKRQITAKVNSLVKNLVDNVKKNEIEGIEAQVVEKIQKSGLKGTRDELRKNFFEHNENEAAKEFYEELVPYAKWVTEFFSEQVAYQDLCYAFTFLETTVVPPELTPTQKPINIKIDAPTTENNKKDSLEKINLIVVYPPATTAPQQPTDTSKKLFFLTYTPIDLSFNVDIDREKEIKLGEIIEATLTIENNVSRTVDIDESLRFNINSNFFKLKEKPEDLTFKGGTVVIAKQTGETEKREIKTLPVVLPGKISDEKKSCIKRKLLLIPKIKEISGKFLESYPITFTLTRSAGFLKQVNDNKNVVSAKTEIQVCKCEKNISIKNPTVDFSVKRPWLPRKGDQIDFTFTVKLEKTEKVEHVKERIPLRIDCVFGSDFTPVDPLPTEAKPKVVTIQKYLRFNDLKGEHFVFTFDVNRAGFPGYVDKANFKLSVDSWEEKEPIQPWKLRMSVLPNFSDTFVAGLIGLAGILHMYRPDIVPSLTEELNIVNLSSTPAIVYLAYRVLNWVKDSKEKPSSE